MPLTHTRIFRVRYYECDAYGRVHHANLLRYMQETAFDASAAAGYDVQRYDVMNRLWLIHETEIEIVRPLRYGEVVEVTTYVADFRRVRSRRAYELRLAGSTELVAQAQTDWVFLDQATQRPVVIPPEMKAAFFPEGAPKTSPRRERFPTPPPTPPGAHRQRRRAEWRDLDQAGHVNNAVYLSYIEDCGVDMAAAHDWPIAVVARSHRIEYKQPALPGDELEVVAWLSRVQGSTAVRHSTVTRVGDGALLVQARTVQEWVDPQTGRSTPLPAALLAALKPSIAAQSGTQG